MDNPMIVLDMDGVIADFEGGLRNWYKTDAATPHSWEINYAQYGMTKETFWDGLTHRFWATLPRTEFFEMVLQTIQPLPWILATQNPSHTNTVEVFSGKAEWIKYNLPRIWKEKRFFIGPDKSFLAAPNRILIDDHEEGNCARWRKAGGPAIVFPRPWNTHREKFYLGGTMTYVYYELKRLLGEWRKQCA